MESSKFLSNNNEQKSSPILIGKGGTCDLFRIMIHNKFHVLKKLKVEYKDSQQHIEYLRREFEIGFQLDHPNIVRYIEYNTNDNVQSILLEFIDGSTLTDVINKQSISLDSEQKKNIILQLCSSIEYLHSKQTYHLDLKPDNILITFRGKNLKLIDFGHSLTDGNTNKVGGTKTFMLPGRENSTFDASDDIYAIGKIIEHLLSNNSSKKDINWNQIINKCLKTDSVEKFKSINELVAAINTPIKKRPSKLILISSIIAFIIIGSLIITQYLGSNKTEPIKGSTPLTIFMDSSETTTLAQIKINPHIKSDSIFCSQLGSSLYTSFRKVFNNSDQTIKSGATLQTYLTDSIQTEWFNYSSKYEPESIDYKNAYNNYYPNFTESQKKIMNLLYNS